MVLMQLKCNEFTEKKKKMFMQLIAEGPNCLHVQANTVNVEARQLHKGTSCLWHNTSPI